LEIVIGVDILSRKRTVIVEEKPGKLPTYCDESRV
jgi:hypothetical protein